MTGFVQTISLSIIISYSHDKKMVLHTSIRNVLYPNIKVNSANAERVTRINF